MNSSGELRHYVGIVHKELDKPSGRHLTDEELMTLFERGDLPENGRSELRSHLTQCHECIDNFKEMRDFLGYDSSENLQLDDIAKERVWKTVRPQTSPVVKSLPSSLSKRSVIRRGSAIAYGLAACLAIMFIVTGILAINLWRQKQALVSQLQKEQQQSTETAGRLKSLEEQQQSQQTAATGTKTEMERQIAQLKQPSVNIPVFDVFSNSSIERGVEAGGSTGIVVPAAAKSFVFLLNGAGQPRYPNYQVEILDNNNKTVWTGNGLKRDSTGNFSLSLTRDFLPHGAYRLRLYGISGQKHERIADYSVRVD